MTHRNRKISYLNDECNLAQPCSTTYCLKGPPCASQRLYTARSAEDSVTGTMCTVFSGSSTSRLPSTLDSLVRRSAIAPINTCHTPVTMSCHARRRSTVG